MDLAGRAGVAHGRRVAPTVLVAAVAVVVVAAADIAFLHSLPGLLAAGSALAAVQGRPRQVAGVGVLAFGLGLAVAIVNEVPAFESAVVLSGVCALATISVLAAEWRERTVAAAAAGAHRRDVLAAVVDSSEDAVLTVDLAGDVRTWNHGAEQLFGRTAAQIVGRPATELSRPGQPGRIMESLARVVAGGQAEPYEVLASDRNGDPVAVSVLVAPVRDPDGRVVGASAVVRDVQQAEARRRALEDRIARYQRAESLGTMAGAVAHDFNNLMAIVSASADMLDDAVAGDPAARRDVAAVRDAAARAGELTAALLAFSRGDVPADVVDLRAVLRDAAGPMAAVLGHGIRLEVDDTAAPARVCVPGTSAPFTRALMDLAANAGEAMPGGGTLRVRLDELAVDRDETARTVPVSRRWARLVVGDTGVGMTPEVAAHAFDPYFTTKQRADGDGGGLGLATVWGTVTRSGGTVTVESEPGRGAVFTIRLPLVAERLDHGPAEVPATPVAAPVRAGRRGPVATGPPAPAPAARPGRPDGTDPVGGARSRGGALTVLVVDDEDALREVVARTLAAVGYTVLTAPDGASALALAAAPDLLLTDVVMPGISGVELARELGARHPGMRVLLMSGWTGDALSAHAVDDSVDLLAKPFTRAELRARVERALGSAGLPVPVG